MCDGVEGADGKCVLDGRRAALEKRVGTGAQDLEI